MAFDRVIEIVIISQTTKKQMTIKDLHISFTVEKSVTQSTNKASVKIWNLSKTTRANIAAKDRIIIRAGYKDEGVASLFFGNIQIVTDTKENINTIVEIEAFDGQYTIQNSTISLSYAAGTSVQTVFNEIILNSQLPLSNTRLVLPGQYASGYSFIGMTKDALTEVLRYAGYTWSIQNEQIVVHADSEVIQKTGLNISPTTGLIGTPQIINNTDDKQVEGQAVLKRWGVKSLLFPQLVPGALVQISSSIVTGFFKVETVNYEADNIESEFTSNMEIVEIV